MVSIHGLMVLVVVLLFIIIVLLSMIGHVADKIHYVLKEIIHKLAGKNE